MGDEDNKKQENGSLKMPKALVTGLVDHVTSPFISFSEGKTLDENGVTISKQDIVREKNEKRVSNFDATKNLILSSVATLNPQRTNKYQVFAEASMRAILRGLKSNLDYSGNEKHAKLIDKWEKKIAAGELLSQSLCSEMVNEFSAELAKVDPVAAKKYQDGANSALKGAFEGIEQNSIKSDERWKWQLLQMFAIFTPLGAFSIAGHVFNYLEPLTEIFGQIFSSDGIAQGVVDILTDKRLGPFAWLVEQIRLDDAVETILTKTPILSDILDTASLITTSDIVHDLGATVAPSAGSELPLILIAGALVLYQSPDEIEHQKSGSKLEAKKKEALKKLDAYPIKPQIKKKEEKKKEESISVSDEIAKINKRSEEETKNKEKPTKSPQPKVDFTKLVGEPQKAFTNSNNGGGVGVR